MPMISCPVCGYDPQPVQTPISDSQLRAQRLKNVFSKNLQNSWWLSQPEYVCRWLKEIGIIPERVLDAGCGDARWLPAICSVWGKIDYLGVDRIAEHQEINAENFPGYSWPTIDICVEPPAGFDTVFIMGTFNPKMEPTRQQKFIDNIKLMKPKHVIVLFDEAQTGTAPDVNLCPEYAKVKSLRIPKELQSPVQNDVVWVYE